MRIPTDFETEYYKKRSKKDIAFIVGVCATIVVTAVGLLIFG